MQNIKIRLWKCNYLNVNSRIAAFKIKPCIIHIQILMTLSLTARSTTHNNNSLAVDAASGAFLAGGATFKCTSPVCDSGNLEIRLDGVLFISEQSSKELSECVQVCLRRRAGSGRRPLHVARSPLAANPVFCRVFMPTQGRTFSRREKQNTADECVYPCDDNEGRGLSEGRGAAASLLYIHTV